MSIRTALAKLAACAAGGALIGGGAVHVAETPKPGAPQYVKHGKIVQTVKPRVRHIARPAPRKVRRIRKVVTTTTTTCEPQQQMAMAAIPYLPPLPPQPSGSSGGGVPAHSHPNRHSIGSDPHRP